MADSVTVTRKYHVSMGNYEWVEFGGIVVLDINDATLAEAFTEAKTALDLAMADDIKEASLNTDEPDSFIHLQYNATKGKT